MINPTDFSMIILDPILTESLWAWFLAAVFIQTPQERISYHVNISEPVSHTSAK